MKKALSLAICLALVMILPTSTLAAPQTIDLETMSIEELQTLVDQATEKIEELTPKPTPEPYKTYKKGSKGEDVKAINTRLIELKYMIGKVDSSYGSKTTEAVTLFQKVAGLPETGIADSETQTRLFDEDAEENPDPPFDPSIYEKMDYKAIARDPDASLMKLITLSGKVVQVIEGDDETQYRIATKGSYDNIVLVAYVRPDGAPRILEDDKVVVYGMCLGVMSYQSTMGGTITIPACMATRIDLK